MKCSVTDCPSSTDRRAFTSISMHRFPSKKKLELREKWISFVQGGTNWQPGDHALICGLHFEPGDFYKVGNHRRLCSGAIPKYRKPTTTSCSTQTDDPELSSESRKRKHEDHGYAVPEGSILQERLQVQVDVNNNLKQELKLERQKVKRLRISVMKLRQVREHLMKEDLISEQASSVLTSFDDVPKQLLQRMTNKVSNINARDEYSPEIRAFSMTLAFYSAKAYRYVREKFHLALPHPSTIRNWYSAIDGKPGFTEESMSTLKARVQEKERRGGGKIYCTLELDEVSIYKGVKWDHTDGSFSGY